MSLIPWMDKILLSEVQNSKSEVLHQIVQVAISNCFGGESCSFCECSKWAKVFYSASKMRRRVTEAQLWACAMGRSLTDPMSTYLPNATNSIVHTILLACKVTKRGASKCFTPKANLSNVTGSSWPLLKGFIHLWSNSRCGLSKFFTSRWFNSLFRKGTTSILIKILFHLQYC